MSYSIIQCFDIAIWATGSASGP